MKRFLALVAILFSASSFAQNLSVHSMDSVAYVNSYTGSLAEAHIALQNNSASTQSYRIIRAQVGTSGLVDSNYFCWDLCYPTWVDQSQGYVDINAGSVAYDFSGYAYVMDTSANGQDTIWYTFENINDSTDFLTVQVIYAFSTTFGQNEPMGPVTKIYPNPSMSGYVHIDIPRVSAGTSIEIVNILGHVQARLEPTVNSSRVTWNTNSAAKGLYFVRMRQGKRIENLGKVLVQ